MFYFETQKKEERRKSGLSRDAAGATNYYWVVGWRKVFPCRYRALKKQSRNRNKVVFPTEKQEVDSIMALGLFASKKKKKDKT
jgi:hypothetical protein